MIRIGKAVFSVWRPCTKRARRLLRVATDPERPNETELVRLCAPCAQIVKTQKEGQ